jgi:hypothetical protein
MKFYTNYRHIVNASKILKNSILDYKLTPIKFFRVQSDKDYLPYNSALDLRFKTQNNYTSLKRSVFEDTFLCFNRLNSKEQKDKQDSEKEQDSDGNNPNNWNPNFIKSIISIFSIIGVGGFIEIDKYRKEQQKEKQKKQQEKINKIESISKENTRDHVTLKGVKNSNKLELKMLIDDILSDADDTKSYLKGQIKIGGNKVTLDTLLHLSNVFNIWASKNMYNTHSSKDILDPFKFVDECINCYFSDKNPEVIKDLDVLFEENKYDEIYNRLKVYDHLVEHYVKSMYLKGMCHKYFHEDEKAISYFKLVEHIGKKDEVLIFEAHLAKRSGIGVINDLKIENSLKEKQKNISLIEANIKSYEELIKNNKPYKKDYRLGKYEIITPKEDDINTLECAKRLIKYHSLVGGKEAKSSIKLLLEGKDDQKGLVDIFKDKDISDRHKASAYNHIGRVLINLLEQDIDCNDLYDLIDKNYLLEKVVKNHLLNLFLKKLKVLVVIGIILMPKLSMV